MELLAQEEYRVFPDTHNPLAIKLPLFEGPLDLLLHLIKKKELDIHEVKLSDLTSSYLSYLDFMKVINLEVAGEFLEIAATLIWIKSKQLLPVTPKGQEDDLDEQNPEEQLKKRLLEYQIYKNAAFTLGSRDILGRDVYTRSDEEIKETKPLEEEELVFEEVSLFALVEAFRQVMERKPLINTHFVEFEQYRIEDRIEQLLKTLVLKSRMSFIELFGDFYSKPFLVISFMAVLEMAKFRLIKLFQDQLFGNIYCETHPEFDLNLEQWLNLQDNQISQIA